MLIAKVAKFMRSSPEIIQWAIQKNQQEIDEVQKIIDAQQGGYLLQRYHANFYFIFNIISPSLLLSFSPSLLLSFSPSLLLSSFSPSLLLLSFSPSLLLSSFSPLLLSFSPSLLSIHTQLPKINLVKSQKLKVQNHWRRTSLMSIKINTISSSSSNNNNNQFNLLKCPQVMLMTNHCHHVNTMKCLKRLVLLV